jgi:hypothetical protein
VPKPPPTGNTGKTVTAGNQNKNKGGVTGKKNGGGSGKKK